MKTIHAIFGILFIASLPLVAFSQFSNIPRDTFYIPIGKDSVVFRYENSEIAKACDDPVHVKCHFLDYVGSLQYIGTDPQVACYQRPNGDTAEIHVTPNALILNETIQFSATQDPNNNTSCGCCNLIPRLYITVFAYYDSKMKIIPFSIVDYANNNHHYNRSPYDSVYFMYDSIPHNYKRSSYTLSSGIYADGGVMLFNNKADSIILSDWKILYDSSHSLSFTMKQDTTIIDSVVMAPLSHLYNLSLQFTSSLQPLPAPRSFPGAIQCTAHFGGKDSVCTIPYTFYFGSGPKSGVEYMNPIEREFSVYPNPAFGAFQISCKGYYESIIHLQITDELGREVTRVFDGKLIGDEIFSVDLGRGIYFVQLRTADGIAMRKILVE
jgi:hypothetical protein